MKSPALTNQPVGHPALLQQTGHCEDDVIVDCNFDHVRRMHHTFDQWDMFNDVTFQNIPRNSPDVVAEILCVAGSLGRRMSILKKNLSEILVSYSFPVVT